MTFINQLHHFGGFVAGFSAHVSFRRKRICLGVAVMVNDAVVSTRVMNLLAAYAYDWWLRRPKLKKQGKRVEKITKEWKGRRNGGKDRAKRAERTWQLRPALRCLRRRLPNDALGALKSRPYCRRLKVSIGNLHRHTLHRRKFHRIELVPGSERSFCSM